MNLNEDKAAFVELAKTLQTVNPECIGQFFDLVDKHQEESHKLVCEVIQKSSELAELRKRQNEEILKFVSENKIIRAGRPEDFHK